MATDLSTDAGRGSGFLICGLTLLAFLSACGSTTPDITRPISAGALLHEYQQSITWARKKYDGKEISVRGLVMSAVVLPRSSADQGAVWLSESDRETGGKVVCWFSDQQAAQFSQIKSGQHLTIRGVFNGEAGADLKFCRLVKVE